MKGETMENVEPVEYDYGKKRNWRRWVWGRIADRVKRPNKEIVVVYLPGGNNLDAMIAEEKGFDLRNLFAVEKDPGKVKALRKMGVNVINRDLATVVCGWQGTPLIDAVIGDYCGGVGDDAQILAVMLPVAKGLSAACLFCLNFLRGRDACFTEFRERAQQYIGDDQKHRGVLFSWYATSCTLGPIDRFYYGDEEVVAHFGKKQTDKLFGIEKVKISKGFGFEFNSYRNQAGNTFYDSVVFNSGFVRRYFEKHHPAILRIYDDFGGGMGVDYMTAARRDIAAAKAHRTMRLKNKVYPGEVWNRKTNRQRRKAR
jgi:hypothetical protein